MCKDFPEVKEDMISPKKIITFQESLRVFYSINLLVIGFCLNISIFFIACQVIIIGFLLVAEGNYLVVLLAATNDSPI